MAISVEIVATRVLDIATDVEVPVNFPLFAEDEVYVYYGVAAIEAVQNVDYTVTLDEPNYNTFSITPTASLLTKINDLIAADPDNEENVITIRRLLGYRTDATPAGVRQTPFTSREFERTVMRFQQLAEQLKRTVTLPPTFVGNDQLTLPAPVAGRALVWNDEATGFRNGPTVEELEVVSAISDEIVALTAIAAQVSAVAAIDDEVVSLYGIRANIVTVASIAPQVTAVAAIDDDVSTVAGIAAAVSTVAANIVDVQNAEENAQLAKNYATEDEDTPVETGPDTYSAKHWAAKAQELRDQVDALLATGRVPLGTIIHSAIPQVDNGFLLCDGSPVTALYPDLRAALIAAGSPFGTSGADPKLPDEVTASRFRRAANGSIPLGTVQDDQIKEHFHHSGYATTNTHPARYGKTNTTANGFTDTDGAAGANDTTTAANTSSVGGSETRPKSIAYLPYIKAFGAITIEGMADLSELLNAIADEPTAVLGENNTLLMTPLRTRQAVAAYNKWEAIEEVTLVAAASYIRTGLIDFDELIFDGYLIPSADALLNMQFSLDNGSSWQTTSDHVYQYLAVNSVANSAAGLTVTTYTGFALSSGTPYRANDVFTMFGQLFGFNKGRRLRGMFNTSGIISAAQACTFLTGMWTNDTTAGKTPRNALRVVPTAGTLSGKFTLSGKRG